MKEKNKGKTIGAWVNLEDQKSLIRRFGEVPDSKTILAHLLNEPIKVLEIDKNTDDILYQLKAIGNNLNQIALKINQNPDKYAPIYQEQIFNIIDDIRKTISNISHNESNNIVKLNK